MASYSRRVAREKGCITFLFFILWASDVFLKSRLCIAEVPCINNVKAEKVNSTVINNKNNHIHYDSNKILNQHNYFHVEEENEKKENKIAATEVEEKVVKKNGKIVRKLSAMPSSSKGIYTTFRGYGEKLISGVKDFVMMDYKVKIPPKEEEEEFGDSVDVPAAPQSIGGIQKAASDAVYSTKIALSNLPFYVAGALYLMAYGQTDIIRLPVCFFVSTISRKYIIEQVLGAMDEEEIVGKRAIFNEYIEEMLISLFESEAEGALTGLIEFYSNKIWSHFYYPLLSYIAVPMLRLVIQLFAFATTAALVYSFRRSKLYENISNWKQNSEEDAKNQNKIHDDSEHESEAHTKQNAPPLKNTNKEKKPETHISPKTTKTKKKADSQKRYKRKVQFLSRFISSVCTYLCPYGTTEKEAFLWALNNFYKVLPFTDVPDNGKNKNYNEVDRIINKLIKDKLLNENAESLISFCRYLDLKLSQSRQPNEKTLMELLLTYSLNIVQKSQENNSSKTRED